MGNSPSKNEASPTSDNQTANSQSSTPSGDLEPDESGPALSQLSSSLTTPRSAPSTSSTTPNEFNDQQGNTRSSAINIRTVNSNHYKSTPSTNNNTKPAPTVNTNTNSSTYTIPNDDRKERKRSGSASPMKARKLELELEIGASMAKLLKTQEYSSSLDSDSGSTVSPVFTTMGECEKRPGTEDEDSLSSLNSGSPSGKTFLYDSKESLPVLSKLDSIAEGTFECSDKEKDASQSSKKLSSSNLKKLQRKSSIGTALTKHLSSTSSSSQLSNSPPLVHSSKKLEVDIDAIIDRLLDVGMKKPSANYTSRRHLKDPLPVSPSEIKYILHKARSIFLEQPTLLRLSPPVKIVGDIHGQFHDLIRIFNSCGYPPYSNYLFLGDYVDRGYKSLETILLLLCYKVKYPENFFMLRGNHESANITKIYGFYDECKRRLPSNKIWKDFIDVFNSLPIAATINDKIFCIHGGLSPDLQDLKQIENIKRPTDIPDKGLLADLLWSDPDPSVKNFSLTNWPKNDRGVSYRFGRKHVDYFCATFKMDLVVRGHMVVEDGYEFFNRRKLVTVFSAPNYCGEFNNFGAVMSVDKSLYCSFELIKPQ